MNQYPQLFASRRAVDKSTTRPRVILRGSVLVRQEENKRKESGEGRNFSGRLRDPVVGGNRIKAEADGRNRRKANPVAHYEYVFRSWCE